MPAEIALARKVEELAQRYHKFPREVIAEGTALLRHVNIVALGDKDG